MNTLTIFLQRFRNTWTIRTMISVKNFCTGQLNSLQNAGNNTEIKPLRRAANYSGVLTVERLLINLCVYHCAISQSGYLLLEDILILLI